LASELNREFPLDTIVPHSYLPESHAEVALQRGDPAKALDLLQAATPYEMGKQLLTALTLLPAYERGRGHFQAYNGCAAALEFQKIIEHSGLVLNSPLGPLCLCTRD